MALGYMRRHRRWLYAFLWVVILGFIVFYIPAFQEAPVLEWIGMDPDLLRFVGTLIIAFGSALLTLGMVGALVDSWRIARAVLIPSPTLKDVLGSDAG